MKYKSIATVGIMNIQIDEEQIKKLFDNAKNKKRNPIDITTLITVIPLLISGIWFVYNYKTFQENSDKLSLKKDSIAVQQTILDTIKARQQIILQSQSSKFILKNDSMNLKQMEIDKALKVIDLKYADLKDSLSIKNALIDNKSKEMEFTSVSGLKFNLTDSLYSTKIQDLDSTYAAYDVLLRVEITNESENVLEVSLSAIEGFYKKIKYSRLLIPKMTENGSPEDVFHNPFDYNTGWNKLFSKFYCFSDESKESCIKNSQYIKAIYLNRVIDETVGYGLTGTYYKGMKGFFSYRYNLVAPKNSIFAMVVSLALNQAKKNDYLRSITRQGAL